MTVNKRDLPKAKDAKYVAKRRALEIEKEANTRFREWEAERATLAAAEGRNKHQEAIKKAAALIEKHDLINRIGSEIRKAIDSGESSLTYVPRRPSGDPWNRWSRDIDVIRIVYERAVKELKLNELGYKTRIEDNELIITWK